MSKKKLSVASKPKEPSTEDCVKTILSQLLSVDESDIDASSKIIEDLGADSLDIVEFVMIMEEQFIIPEIPESQAEKIITVGDAVKLIERMKRQ